MLAWKWYDIKTKLSIYIYISNVYVFSYSELVKKKISEKVKKPYSGDRYTMNEIMLPANISNENIISGLSNILM